MDGSAQTDDEWLLAKGIDADPDELHDFQERVGKFFYGNADVLHVARTRALECLRVDRSNVRDDLRMR